MIRKGTDERKKFEKKDGLYNRSDTYFRDSFASRSEIKRSLEDINSFGSQFDETDSVQYDALSKKRNRARFAISKRYKGDSDEFSKDFENTRFWNSKTGLVEDSAVRYEEYYNWKMPGFKVKYRSNCGTYRMSTTCEHHPKEALKHSTNHCNKLDCEICFPYACLERAGRIEEKIQAFKKACNKLGITIGNVIHLSLNPKPDYAIPYLESYEKFTQLKNEAIKLAKKAGIIGGIIVTQPWRPKCLKCGKSRNFCVCDEHDWFYQKSPHFHILGYGYLQRSDQFHVEHPDWTYTNFRWRNDVKGTAFYTLTRCGLWFENDRQKPAYIFFGELSYNKHKIIKKYKSPQTDDCPICGEPRRVILNGLEISGDKIQVTEFIRGSYQIIELTTENSNHCEINGQYISKECFIMNENFKATLYMDKLGLGQIYVYNKTIKIYEIKNPEKLKVLMKQIYQKYRNWEDPIEDG